MNNDFNEEILADKLSKLNGSQQCIETLSHWCIFHQKKAELVVQTWDKQFHNSQKEDKVPFLYLANDILQNSRRKGTEFVSEFWKVLPAALKEVFENGDDRGKNTVSRLVKIWEERRVFGSRARGLKDLMLGNEPLPALELNNKKRSRSVRILRRDSRSIKVKLATGATVEKIVSAFHVVISEHPNENMDLNKCKATVRRVRKMEKDVDIACAQVGDPRRAPLADKLQEEETILKQCMEKLKSVEETRVALVSQLKEALKEQESELENVCTQLQVAQAQVEEAINMRKRLNNETVVRANPSSSSEASQMKRAVSAGETPKKSASAIAAEVVDKLTASTSSQQIMSSVLSTFAAEEAKNAGLTSSAYPSSSYPEFPTEKRPKVENPMPFSGATTGAAYVTASPVAVPAAHQQQMVFMPQPPIQSQAFTTQPHYSLLPTVPSQQYLQAPGGMMFVPPYGYSSLPTPPPLPAPQPMNMARPTLYPLQQPMPSTMQQPAPLVLQQPMLQQQQQSAPMLQPIHPPSMGFYGLPPRPQ